MAVTVGFPLSVPVLGSATSLSAPLGVITTFLIGEWTPGPGTDDTVHQRKEVEIYAPCDPSR